MALSDESGGIPATMLVSPNGGNGFGGGFGGDWGWIILLLLLAGGGWGNGMGGFGGGDLYPWLNNSNQINDGFRDQMMNSTILGIQNAVTSGFGDVQNALVTNQMASMQQSFGLSQQLAQCCCDNRLATVQTQNVAQSEGALTRSTIQGAVQSIHDKLCQLELDGKNDRIADLERQLTMANLAASQGAQTARILADNAAQTVALEQYLAPTPRPAWIVQNPSCCSQNYGGCGCGG